MRTTSARGAGFAAALVALLGALAACGERAAGPAPASDPAAAVATPEAGAAPEEALPPGRVRIQVGADGLTLIANAAPRRPVFEMLARQLSFELVAPDLGNEPITVKLEGGDLRDVLPALLSDRAYRVEVRVDPATRRHALARLEIAGRGELALSAPREASQPASVAAAEPVAAPASPAPPAAAGAVEAHARADGAAAPGTDPGRVDWRDLVLRLDAADAEDRIDVLQEIDPDGDGLPLIIDRLARDPDPRVRAAAASRLELSETLAGVDALVAALSDPDREVVLAAIDALELTEDPTVAEDLAPLLAHPDAEIRQDAEDAIDFIRDDEDLD